MSEWYLYLIRVKNGSLYTGIATDVERRFSEHVVGGKKGAKYLRGRGPLTLVFRQKVGSRSQALKTEAVVKKMPRAQKENLIRGPGCTWRQPGKARGKKGRTLSCTQ